jgi:hypothetical protein
LFECKSSEERVVYNKLNSTGTLIQETPWRLFNKHMYYIGLDVHKKTISYCVKDLGGQIQREGTIPATRTELDSWMKTLPQPWTVAMEASIFTGWPITALSWALEISDVSRFRSVKQAISYWGLCGDEKSSADHELALVYERAKQKGNTNRATIAVARKMVTYLLAVDRGQRPFVAVEDFSTAVA